MAVVGVAPFVLAPMQSKWLRLLDAQSARRRDEWNLPIFFPYLDWRARLALAIAVGNFGYEVEDYAVRGRTQKFQVLCMRPHQRHRCACGFAVEHQLRRQVREIPDLLGQKPRERRKVFHRAQEWPDIAAGGEFIVAALACQ